MNNKIKSVVIGIIIFMNGMFIGLIFVPLFDRERNEVYYPKSCLLEENPKFGKYNYAQVIEGAILSILLCGLDINITYNVGYHNPDDDVYFKSELFAQYIFINFNHVPDDRIATLLLIEDHFIHDSMKIVINDVSSYLGK
jgi:hypothetical protein